MSGRSINANSSVSDNLKSLTGSDFNNPDAIQLSLDLVAAARSHVSFLRRLAAYPLVPTYQSIQRYEKLWMPLVAELANDPSAVILPPVDVGWVWHCHCLTDPVNYQQYCITKFGIVIERPMIYDKEIEDYALFQCREIWEERYPSEPFDIEAGIYDGVMDTNEEVYAAVEKYQHLVSYFSDLYISETVYLVSSKHRYFSFLQLMRNFESEGVKLSPTSDILLMWLTHKSFPASYAKDMDELGDLNKRIVDFGDQATEKEVNKARRIWEEAFDEPYERPGALFDPICSPSRIYFNWNVYDVDVNRRYKGLQARFLMEVCVFLKGKLEIKHGTKTFIRLKAARCHKLLKLDKPISTFDSDFWQKSWHMFCEFGTRAIILELREDSGKCFIYSKLLESVVLSWNDLLRATSFTLGKGIDVKLRVMASITPPIQAPYLLKCVPDRVTDDAGAMISEVILRNDRYRPQEGRWLTRTVLDHGGRERFVVRMRVGRGIWRRGAENPVAVKWEDRIIEVREGPWSYVASSVGYAPEKVAGTATPKREADSPEKVTWCLSTGHDLKIQWVNGPRFYLETNNSSEMVRLLNGRKMQYQNNHNEHSKKEKDEEEDDYVTVVRCTADHPKGKATALLNWRLLAVEFSPEEDATVILLVCMCVARTICEYRREDVARLLVRRRVREVKSGLRDWGSVMVPSSDASHHLQPWYWNGKDVVGPTEDFEVGFKYSAVDGKDALYKQSILQ